MKRKICWMILVGLLVLFAPTLSAHAQEKSVVMPGRTGEVTIRPDGKVDICETWTVQFIGGPFKYARRIIPLNKVEAIAGWRISENGQPYQQATSGVANTYQVATEDNQRIAIWYFTPTTDQTRTFEVCYTLVGALRIGETQDEFYWKFIEPDRSYPVEAVQVKLNLPKTFAPSDLEASTYVNGSQKDGAQVVDSATVTFTGGPIKPNQEWELRVRFPHGAVSAAPPAWQAGAQANAVQSSTAQALVQTVKGVLFGLGLVMIVALVVLVMVFGRRYRNSTPEGAFARIMKRLYGWPLIVLGMLTTWGGAILAASLGLPQYLMFGAMGTGMLIFAAGGIAQGTGNDRWGSGGSHFGGGGGSSGGGGGGGSSDFG
jgi:hypothetical protein